jgi:type VI secretion system secreted protein VgrG
MKQTNIYGTVLLLAALLFLCNAAAASSIPLGAAGDFAVLAGSSVANTGSTVVDGGDIGVSPGSTVTGFPPGILVSPYTFEEGTATAAQAEADLTVAYADAAGLPVNQALTGQNLGGLTLTPGVYFFSSSAQLTGTLTLNDEGNPNAQFVFQIGSTLTTAAGSSVVTINSGGASPGLNVFWQVGSSATLGTGTDFEGNILANASITADAGASDLDGRLLAENGSVTLDANAITVPPPFTASVPDAAGTILLLGCTSAAMMALRRRFSCFA